MRNFNPYIATKNASENVICKLHVVYCMYLLTLLTNASIKANSVDLDQTAPTRSDSTLSKRLPKHFSIKKKK